MNLTKAAGVYRFDGFILDLDRGVLLSPAGAELSLRRKSFDLLCILVANAGRLLDRDTLNQAIWSDVIVTDDAITQCVRDVRLAIGDAAQRIVKTVPRRGYVFAAKVTSASDPILNQPATGAGTLADTPSIAVLPFQNLSGDPEQEYFADGIVEDITTALSRTGWLFVIARNSSFAYKGKSPDIRAVGRELGVRYVLEGSIRKSAKRIRITCQLIEAATAGHVWAERFDGEMADIFDVQDHIAAAVVGAVEPGLKRAEIARATAKPTERLDAYDLYLRAWPYYNAGGREASDTAITLLRQALEIDPAYVRAKALLASAYATRNAQQFEVPGDREMGIALAREILEIGTDDPEALCRVGFTLSQLSGDFPAAFAALDRALRLHPNSVLILNRLAWVHCHANDPEPAIALWQRAIRLSPLDPSMGAMLLGLGTAHLMAARNAEALPFLQRAVQEAPRFLSTHRMLIHCLTRLNRPEEARAAATRLLAIRPDYRVGPAPTYRFTPAFWEERRQAELAAGLSE